MTSIYLFSNGECKAEEFIEDNFLTFNDDGTVHYTQFVEGSPTICASPNAFYVNELIENIFAYLVDEYDAFLLDESGNYLTAIV